MHKVCIELYLEWKNARRLNTAVHIKFSQINTVFLIEIEMEVQLISINMCNFAVNDNISYSHIFRRALNDEVRNLTYVSFSSPHIDWSEFERYTNCGL